ncbi:hypothetical protein Tsubulata_011558 [Turnera subulata]|uniref:HECT-type E3 ubiquitin transferase n=1 Tax=Turnera subulata TaxID=218843 RepID=A0A9Q0G3B6_9ROSI|nr:hypothetical protein Tsubulata_011558 [Turnera subulata]
MGNRGQKRTEMVDELPADKRACSSLEFKPSSSNSSMQTPVQAANPETQAAVHTADSETHDEAHDADMETSSSGSGSSRSEDEERERDSAYGSCDSDDPDPRRGSLREYQRQRASGDYGRLKTALSGLSEGTEPSVQLAALTELCEVLSFSTEDSLSSVMADLLSPVLVRLARHDSNPDIMLLAIRALTYLCDVFPRASVFLIKHDAVAALCQRLMAIEYLDVAEQCLQALEKISRDQPLACLQAGAIMAVLSFIDFFSTSVQRVALSTVVNICKKLPLERFSLFMEATPTLCNLLQYEDRQLVEYVVICLIKIAERVSQSSDMLDELCKHGLVNQVVHLIQSNSRTTLSQPIYNGLIGLLVKLCSGSTVAFRTLYELNISSVLKDILTTYDLSHGISSPHVIDGHGNQVHEVLKLLNVLLPTVARDQDLEQAVLDKESFLAKYPDLLHKFGLDILPMLIQVVNSGANLYVCYGCLRAINKLVFLSEPDLLAELLKNVNLPSFLTGVFTRRDHHVLMLALQIAETVLQKLSDVFLNSFIKEGVFFAIDSLLTPEKCSKLTFPVCNSIQLPIDASQKSVSKVVLRCLCYAFDTGQCPAVAESGKCIIEEDSVQNLAKHVRTSYFSLELCDSEKGSDILQYLRALSAELCNLTYMSESVGSSNQDEEKCCSLLHQIIAKLDGREPVSTFEFIASGIVKSLVNYISNGKYLRLHGASNDDYIVEKRFEVFANLFLVPSDHSDELPLLVFVRKLQSSLSSLETFPVILSHAPKYRSSYAVVPNGCSVSHPCLRMRFVLGEGETYLSEYPADTVTVDPFSSLNAIERFLLSKVKVRNGEQTDSAAEAIEPMETAQAESPSNTNSGKEKSSGIMEPDSMSTDLPGMQEDESDLSQSTSEQPADVKQGNRGETSSQSDAHIHNDSVLAPFIDTGTVPFQASAEHTGMSTSATDISMKSQQLATPCDDGDTSPKLVFYLEGQELEKNLTLYQAILQQKIKADHDFSTTSKLWSQTHSLTYRVAIEHKDDDQNEYCITASDSSMMHEAEDHGQHDSFFSTMFESELASIVDNSSSTYDILFMLKCLEGLNKLVFHLMSRERIHAFGEGLIDSLDGLKVLVRSISQNEFVNIKLTEKLEQQMRDSLAVSVCGMPFWCNQLMASCPFLFSFEARSKYFRLAAFGSQQAQLQPSSHNNSGISRNGRPSAASLSRKKFVVFRDRVLESAAQMMDAYAQSKLPVEVIYDEEVGTGLGPTLEFYTLVSHEFQKSGLDMWRQDYHSFPVGENLQGEYSGFKMSPLGLFPRPWRSMVNESDEKKQFSEVTKMFFLLGQVVAKALQDGRVLDLPFSKAFYKLILQQELNLYDIKSFDPELGRTLLEFQALAIKKRRMESSSAIGETSPSALDVCYWNTRIDELYLDFTLPGYPDYVLTSDDHKMVNIANLEEYVALVVDATVRSGISKQIEAFKSGFNQVFPIEHLKIFTEEELERLLCGERDFWAFNELLDHIKFDHGYTASSPPIINVCTNLSILCCSSPHSLCMESHSLNELQLLEILLEFKHEQRRAFLQFVTGAPRLPPGGLASLNPKLTIVRKQHSGNCADVDLPSVMTCANYLKLPPYSSKDKMKEKLLYAITEGQGSFHLS